MEASEFQLLMNLCCRASVSLPNLLIVQAVFPGEFGIPRQWYFFLQASYWCGPRRDSSVSQRHDPPLFHKIS
jgi:hypothetical protein